ncbi:SDR family NAD(P)-dependent oxidoreductase [Rhodococcus qingshengii]|uniref:SDR family NAD(P)-dependent oxidoreductase n=1 Tax=Rhodococcus qingshengii TaxID=334542 RepID=UPI001BE5FAB8|nr:SDR family NAD(P)-dependent oxidoreductase [Rhodococcus qingshengii]MBT2270220.1 SDR family NAD(P)-dependent oxidoreductase [Rhodococcus qingshengii]
MRDAVQDQVWFITGANSGFGFALSTAVLTRGGRVAAAVRSLDGPAVATLQGLGEGRLHVVRLDVTNTQDVHAVVDDAVEHFGHLDVVVNSAGRGSFGSLEETPDAEVRDLFEVNLFGSLNVIRMALPILRRQGRGHLVQISSLAGIAPPAPGLAAYAATKFAVEGISEVLAKEVAHLGIGVTIVEPGDFRTSFGNSLHVTPPALPDYAESVGAAAQTFASMDPTQLGDPDNAAAVIIDAVTSAHPPLRLALGEDAIEGIKTKLAEQRAEAQTWEAVGRGMR